MKTDASTWTEYHYDYEQRLTQVKKYVSSSLNQTITYTYDPMGNLIKKTDGATTTTYVQDLNSILPDVLIATTGNIVEKLTRGYDLLKVNRSGDEQSKNSDFYYYTDALGSIRTITKTDGTIICRYVYDVYGKPLSSETNETQTWNVFKFTGELYDEDTELLYLRARWYDINTGRFITRDRYSGQFDNPLTLHRYGYCQGDPVNHVDPSGYFEWRALTQAIVMSIRSALSAIYNSAVITLRTEAFRASVWQAAGLGLAQGTMALLKSMAQTSFDTSLTDEERHKIWFDEFIGGFVAGFGSRYGAVGGAIGSLLGQMYTNMRHGRPFLPSLGRASISAAFSFGLLAYNAGGIGVDLEGCIPFWDTTLIQFNSDIYGDGIFSLFSDWNDLGVPMGAFSDFAFRLQNQQEELNEEEQNKSDKDSDYWRYDPATN